ncbi:MAG: hypothetical protein EKK46_08325 [Rhodocyclaceae bacterium]|nr:MAG: hypothetical protein EKK46_08325 [Rhodocyclaceae bacterium]
MNDLTNLIEHPLLFLFTTAIALAVLGIYWPWFFGDIHGFVDDLEEAAKPDWYAWWQGRYWEGEWAEFKLGAFALLSLGVIAACYKLGLVIFY